MDIVPHTSAVRRVVVITKYPHMIQLAQCHLCHIGHQIVGDSVGILAQQTADVSTDRVEIPQSHSRELRIGSANVPQNLFDHDLGVAIGIRCRGRHFLHVGSLIVAAVNGRTGGENYHVAVILPHDTQQGECTADVVLVVFQRLFHRFANCLQTGEVNYGIDLVVLKNLPHVLLVTHVCAIKPHMLSGDHLDTGNCLHF